MSAKREIRPVGTVTIDDPSVVHKADYMLYFSQKPFSNSDF